jgi:SAM-dependent methyltransferase
MIDNTLSYFKKIYPIPHFYMIRAVESKLLQEYIIRDKAPFLDLGCGDGSFTRSLALDNLYGIDIALAPGKNYIDYRQVLTASASEIPFAGDFFGTAFSNCAPEHMDELDKVLLEVYRVLKPRGEFIFTVPSDNFIKLFYKSSGLAKYKLNTDSVLKEYNHTHHHVNILSLEEWRQRLESANFRISAWEYYLPEELAEFVILADVLYTVKRAWFFKLIFQIKTNYGPGRFSIKKKFNDYYSNIHFDGTGSHLIIKAKKK